MIGIVPLVMLAQAGATPLPVEASDALRANEGCLRVKVLELEPSGADIDELFSAGKTFCGATYVSAIFAIQAAAEQVQPAPSKSPREIAWDMVNGTESDLKNELRLKVLEIRASRSRGHVQ